MAPNYIKHHMPITLEMISQKQAERTKVE
uniref:Uncharacterized protein n=1 Tax=Rhizophora mucronata TaxID=61149 RepID=A0A2P2J7Q7_RHIMU